MLCHSGSLAVLNHGWWLVVLGTWDLDLDLDLDVIVDQLLPRNNTQYEVRSGGNGKS